MKNLAKASLWLLLTGVIVVLSVGCGANRKAAKPLAVERQICPLKHIVIEHLDEFDATISYDYPVNAPKCLTDSITEFFNRNLYDYFEDGTEIHVPYQNVYSTDLPHIAERYWNAYKSFYEDNDLSTHWLDMNMVAQTDTYITYQAIWAFRGEGVHEGYEWITFVKNDGHRLNEVISDENLLRFFEDYPELSYSDIMDAIRRNLSAGFSFCETGLLNDSLAFVYEWAGGHNDIEKYDLNIIKPYLSKEAQKLVSGNGKNK